MEVLLMINFFVIFVTSHCQLPNMDLVHCRRDHEREYCFRREC